MDHLRSGVQDQPGQHGKTQNTKISRAWWHMPVVPATPEAEARESREPGRRRLQRAEIVPLHSSLGSKSKILSQKKKKRKEKLYEGKPRSSAGSQHRQHKHMTLDILFQTAPAF